MKRIFTAIGMDHISLYKKYNCPPIVQWAHNTDMRNLESMHSLFTGLICYLEVSKNCLLKKGSFLFIEFILISLTLYYHSKRVHAVATLFNISHQP